MPSLWCKVKKADPRAAALADRHYNRVRIGHPQFMPPGQTFVLLTEDAKAVWGWWRPHPAAGLPAYNGLDGWTCTLFRNEGPHRSSQLITAAEQALINEGYDIGPTGFITYVRPDRIRSTNPGYCFQLCGWRKTGFSKDRKKILLIKPREVIYQEVYHEIMA